ncbi:hypothetical protein ABW19_dt0206488 [Dactylella cylindrospora]|nr:hypothetical protein ABW19_dt0206488 [Dactylella cylindrospora]
MCTPTSAMRPPATGSCITIGRIILTCILAITYIAMSDAHPTPDNHHCLAEQANVVKTLVGEVNASKFGREVVADHFNVEARSNEVGSTVDVYYTTSRDNKNPIITMASGKLSAVEAIAFADGKVKAVGSLWWVRFRAGRNANLKDLDSKVILPGFVEPHLHILFSAMLKGYILDVSPLRAPTYEDSMALLRAELSTLKAGEWLVAHGYDPSRMAWRDLTRQDLDEQVSSTVPVLVLNASGHLGYANSKAFELANVTNSTPNPVGGEYVKDANGQLTGVLVEQGAIVPFVGKASAANKAEEVKIPQGIAKVLTNWLSKGVTTAFDAALGITSADEFKIVAGLSDTSPIRISGAVSNFSPGQAEKILGTGPMPPGGFKAGNLTVKTVKLFTDGSTQGFTAAVNQEYLQTHFPSYFHDKKKGILVWPDQNPGGSEFNSTFHDEVLKWISRGYQVMVHANGDRASNVVLDTFSSIFREHPQYKKKLLHRIEHFTVTEPAQIVRAKALGLGVSHTMGHIHFWGDTFKDGVLGEDRAFRIDPVYDDWRYKLPYSFNSDSPVTDVDPLLWVRTAITRKIYKTGNILGKEQRVGLEEALRGVTIYPALQVLRGDTLGTLEVGKFADFVVLSEDLRRWDWEGRDIGELKVLETWVGGVRRWIRGEAE